SRHTVPSTAHAASACLANGAVRKREVAKSGDSFRRPAATERRRRRQPLVLAALTDTPVTWNSHCKTARNPSRGIRVSLPATGKKDDVCIAEWSGGFARRRQAVAADRSGADDRAPSAAMSHLSVLLDAQAARIAAALHDDVSQVLAVAQLAIEEVAGESPKGPRTRLRQVRSHLHDVADQLRRLSHKLHPGILDDLEVTDAIACIARRFARQTGVRLTTDVRLDAPCSTAVDAVLYRFVEEALANIGAHARATAASVAIARDGARLHCAATDNGVGFDVAALARSTNRGLGLMLVRRRLEALGGTLDIASAPQRGTCLSAVIPVET